MTKEAQQEETYEKLRRQLWVNVYVAYVASSNSTSNDLAAKWADTAIFAYEKRFKAKKDEEN
jgi:hypothetical protein